MSKIDQLLKALKNLPEKEQDEIIRKLHQRKSPRKLTIERISDIFDNKDQLLDDFETACCLVNELCHYMNKLGMPVEFDNAVIEHLKNDSISSRLKHSKRFFRDGENLLIGQAYETAVRTLRDVCILFFCGPKTWTAHKKLLNKKLAIAGSCQAGKTAVFAAAYHLIPVITYVMSRGQTKYVPFLTIPQYKSMREQTKKALLGFREIYGDLIVRNDSIECSINNYWEMMEEEGCFVTADQLINGTIIIRTTSGVKDCKNIIEEYINLGYTPLPFTDEAHFGAGKEGNQDKLLKQLKQMREAMSDFSEITISATPDEQSAGNVKDDWNIIHMWLGLNYCGPSHCNGVRLPSVVGYKEVLPQNQEINDYCKAAGIHKVDISRRAYEDFNKFCRNVLRVTPDDAYLLDWDNYKEMCAEQTVDICRNNFDWAAGRRSATIRSVVSNRGADRFVRRMQAYLTTEEAASIVFIRLYGSDSRKLYRNKTIKEVIREHHRQGKFTIIVVTANARCGYAFPASNAIFIDWTARATTAVSLLQGLYGRACGYGKVINGQPPIVLVSRLVNTQIESLKQNKFRLASLSRPGQRSRKKHLCLNRGPRKNYFLKSDVHPEVQKLRYSFSEAWILCGRQVRSQPTNELSCRFNSIIRNKILTKKFIANVWKYLPEKDRGLRFLNWGEEDSWMPGCVLAANTAVGQLPRAGAGLRFPDPTIAYEAVIGGVRTARYDEDAYLLPNKALKSTSITSWIENDPSEAAKSCRESLNTRRQPFGRGIVEIQLVFRLVDDECPECGSIISKRCYAMRASGSTRKQGGHWPEEVRSTCCWGHSRIKWEGVQLRIKEDNAGTAIADPHEINATEKSRYLI